MANGGTDNHCASGITGICAYVQSWQAECDTGGGQWIVHMEVYILVRNIIDDVFIPSLAASLWAAIYAEIAARIMKAPANQYLIVGLIPLLPGAPLYYTLSAAFDSDWKAASAYGNSTMLFVLGIAVGISSVCGCDDIIRRLKNKKAESLSKHI